jgi:hypothetical protein
MLAIRSGTLAKMPRRRFFSVSSRNQRSTWLSHEEDVLPATLDDRCQVARFP